MVPQGLDLELSVMQDAATALGRLDPSARARVLRWLQERFARDASPLIEPKEPTTTRAMLHAVPQPVPVVDEGLSVETLGEMFNARSAAPVENAPKTITGLLNEFVAEFQDIAREWDDACTAPVETPRPARLLSAAS